MNKLETFGLDFIETDMDGDAKTIDGRLMNRLISCVS